VKLLPAVVFPLLAVVGGCNTPGNGLQLGGAAVQPGGAAYPGTSIFPVGDVQLAQVYVAEKNPADSNLPHIKNICPDDFSQTKALMAVAAKYQTARGTSALDDREEYTTALNASITGIPIKIVTVGANIGPTATTSVNYSGVQIYSVDDADLQTVWHGLGDDCKKLIKKYSGFLVAGAVKASTMNIEVKKNNDPNVTAGLKVGSISPGFAIGGQSDSDVSLSGRNMYFKVSENPSQ
jgi:hypothetical protein